MKEALQFDDDEDDALEDDNDENDGDDNDDDDSDSGNEVDDDDVKEEAKVSDLDFLKKKTVKGNFDDDESDESDAEDDEDDEEEEGDDDDDEEEADGRDVEEMEEAEEAEVRPFSSCSLLPARKRTLVVCLGFAGGLLSLLSVLCERVRSSGEKVVSPSMLHSVVGAGYLGFSKGPRLQPPIDLANDEFGILWQRH